MKLKGRQKLALVIAGAGDLIDFGIGAVPGLGEPLDLAVAFINSFLLKDPRPMLGLTELIPVGVVDFLPVHTLSAWWAIKSDIRSPMTMKGAA